MRRRPFSSEQQSEASLLREARRRAAEGEEGFAAAEATAAFCEQKLAVPISHRWLLLFLLLLRSSLPPAAAASAPLEACERARRASWLRGSFQRALRRQRDRALVFERKNASEIPDIFSPKVSARNVRGIR
jgi:hypothetical protein